MALDRSTSANRAGLALLAVLLAIATGCAGEEQTMATSTTSPPTTTTTSSTTTTTLPPTTTTLGPREVLDTFVGHITDPGFAGRADLSIEATVGDVSVSGTGRVEFAGEDSYSLFQMAGFPAEESITIDGVDYRRVGDGPWVTEESVPDPFAEPIEESPSSFEDLEFLAGLKLLGDLEHQGVMEADGVTLHRIGLPEGIVADPLAFGVDEDEQVAIDFVFWANSDGVPYRLQFSIEDTTDPELPTKIDMDFDLVEVGAPVQISSPDDPWLTHTSTDLGYTIAHPPGWEVEEIRGEVSADFFYGLDGEELHVFPSELDAPERVSLNAVLDVFRSALVGEYGYEFGDAEEIEVLGLPARLVTYSGEDEFYGSFAAVYVVFQPELEIVSEFTLFGDANSEGALRELLDDFLSTFEFG